MTKICIVGAGAVGGYVGAQLARAGFSPTLIDAWPHHVQTVQSRGLRVEDRVSGSSFTAPVRILHVCDVQQLIKEPPFDLAFISVKAYDTEWATHLALPYLRPDGVVVSLQNGINEERIAAIVGAHRTMGCAISALAAELIAPGHVVRTSPMGTSEKSGMRIGEMTGLQTVRAELVRNLLSHADTCKVTTNLAGERWSKLTINAMRNGLCAATGMTGRERDTNPLSREVSIRLGSSCVRVGRALGLVLEPVGGLDLDLLERADYDNAAHNEITRMIMEVAMSRSDSQRPSMGQDIQKGRRTEIDDINGLVVHRGTAKALDVSLHQRLCDVMHGIERGEISACVETLDRIAGSKFQLPSTN